MGRTRVKLLGWLAELNIVSAITALVAVSAMIVLTIWLSCLRGSPHLLELSAKAGSHAAAVEVRRWPPGIYGDPYDVALYIIGPEMVGCSVIAAFSRGQGPINRTHLTLRSVL